MPHETALIGILAAGFALAFIFGLIAVRLRLPPLVGYLLAGVAVGPFTPGFVADHGLAQQLSEIGVILLMFGVGIHFSVGDLLSVRRIALPGAVVQITAATALGAVLAHFWGWSWGAGLVFGLCLSVASTVVLLRALEDRGLLDSGRGRIAVGWLIVEDLATVIVLVLLPALAPMLGAESASGTQGPSLAIAIATTFLKVTAFVVVMFVVGRRAVPLLLERVARIGSRELFTLAILAIAIGIAVGAAYIFGVSFALGAFFAGMIVNSSRLSHEAARDALPLQDAFSVLFFVAVGMLFDPTILVEQPLRLLAVVAIVMVGKSIAAFLIVFALGYPKRTALLISASLAQIGEFSFILAALGVSLGILSVEGQSLIVAGALVSIALNPLAFGAATRISDFIDPPADAAHTSHPHDDEIATYSDHAVIVGFGRVGSVVASHLSGSGLKFVVVEDTHETVDGVREQGIVAIHGDASREYVLKKTGLERASVLIITAPDPYVVRAIVEVARRLNPGIPTVARTHSEVEKRYLEENGADIAVVGEHELATAMGRIALERSVQTIPVRK